MPDGDKALFESEIEVSSRVSQRLERALDELVRRGQLKRLGVERILGALNTLPPEAAKRILQEATNGLGIGPGTTPLIDRISKSTIDPDFVADPTSEAEPEAPSAHPPHATIEGCKE